MTVSVATLNPSSGINVFGLAVFQFSTTINSLRTMIIQDGGPMTPDDSTMTLSASLPNGIQVDETGNEPELALVGISEIHK